MVRGLTGWALAVRETPRAYWRRLPGSPQLRVLRLLRETSPALLVMLGLFIVAAPMALASASATGWAPATCLASMTARPY
jgi:hypothetical protein